MGELYVSIAATTHLVSNSGYRGAMISVYYYLRVVVFLCMREPEHEARAWPALIPAVTAALSIAAVLIVRLGLWPGSVIDVLRHVVAMP